MASRRACADEARAGLARIAATLDEVAYTTFANLANIDLAMNRIGTGLMPLIELRLMATRSGPALDFPDARAFLEPFTAMVDAALRRKIN